MLSSTQRFQSLELSIVVVSSYFGFAAAFCTMLGTICYNKHLDNIPGINVIPGINALPKMIGSLFMMLSGLFWLIEALMEEPPIEASSRWSHVRNKMSAALKGQASEMAWGVAAGVCTFCAGTMTLISLYLGTSILFWPIAGLSLASGISWFQSASRNPKTAGMNKTGAVIDIISTGLFFASIVLAPYVSVAMIGTLVLVKWVTGYISPGLWMTSYFADDITVEPEKTPSEIDNISNFTFEKLDTNQDVDNIFDEMWAENNDLTSKNILHQYGQYSPDLSAEEISKKAEQIKTSLNFYNGQIIDFETLDKERCRENVFASP